MIKNSADDKKTMTGSEYQAVVRKTPRKKEEQRFETNLSVAASYKKCMYVKIPDPIYGSQRVKDMKAGKDFHERRRPFDGMLIINADEDHYGGIYAVEAKYDSNGLEKHQRNNLTLVHNINNMAYVIRCRTKNRQYRYYVEWPEKTILYETDNLNDFIDWFKELSRIKK